MLRRLAVIMSLVLTPARAEEPNLAPDAEAAPGAASQLVLAQRLFRRGSEAGDPVLLLAAIRLARGVTVRPAVGWERTAGGAGETPQVDGPSDPGSAAALAMLQGLAVDDPDLQDLTYDLDAQLPQGRLPVATVAKSGLGGGAEEDWLLPLSGAVVAEIAVIGDGGSVLGLSVTDDSGAVVCARPATKDPALCRFTPARNGFFRVRVSNEGAEASGYLLVGN
ncbi:hypothetical protein [Tabrizicola sp.]|uniref:hypothetical protein n=1 Tax=Tabrizicola sp. TaxID=2005166 RepID=UPI002FDDAFA4